MSASAAIVTTEETETDLLAGLDDAFWAEQDALDAYHALSSEQKARALGSPAWLQCDVSGAHDCVSNDAGVCVKCNPNQVEV